MKKVLIISYYWPPAGGSGVQRWLKFAKYLPIHNWKPIIYTPENPYFEIKDEKLLSNVPEEAEIWKKAIWEPYALKDKLFGKGSRSQSAGVISNKSSLKNKVLNWIRGNVFIPDPKIYWVKSSVRFLKKKIKEKGIQYIITTGPPHSMHLIGLALKTRNPELKWIADFRDPWSELDLLNEFHLLESSRDKHKRLEREVLQMADMTLTVSESWVNDLKRLGAKNVALITNGYDSTDFDLKPKKTDKFIIGHYGLLNHLRNPINLWETLNKLCKENKELNSKLEIHLSGNIDTEVITKIKSYTYLKRKVKELKYLSHSKVLQEYNEASVLLLLLFNSETGKGNYPGKIFEYFAAQKPILAFGPSESNARDLIIRTNSGKYFSYDDANLRDTILGLFRNETRFDFKNTEYFSREKLTQVLSGLLNKL